MPQMSRSIAQSFADLRGRRSGKLRLHSGKLRLHIGLVPFLPAGFPDLATTAATLQALDAIAPAAIEIGFPFSDPIADGPTIQQAFTAALARNVKVSDVFAMVRDASRQISTPLLAMLSYSIVFRYGADRFSPMARPGSQV